MYSSHAALDLAGRLPKAEKIRRLLPLSSDRKTDVQALEVGTGSGAIAHFFSKLSSPRFNVWAVDVEDQRITSDGFQFKLYDGQKLPFTNDLFDIVISNHVIEHVGARSQQVSHVLELCRVLKPGGYIYLATPSRWQIMEPHFSLPFLSWFPRSWGNCYVRLAGKGKSYDCWLLRPVELLRILQSLELPYLNLTVQAFRELISIERPRDVLARVVSKLPSHWLENLCNFSPTLIYLIHKPLASETINT